MASTRELYIQLGFQPSNGWKNVPHPAIGIIHQYLIPEPDEMFRMLRPYSGLRKVLLELRKYVEVVVDASSPSDIGTTIVTFLDKDDNGGLCWSKSSNLYQPPQWPRDKEM